MRLNKNDDNFALVWAKKIKAIRLLGGKCLNCANDNIFCLEFHHINGKEFGINTSRCLRWSKTENELKKCVLLCRNCHSEQRCDINGRRHDQKKWLLESIGRLKCEKCGYVGKNYASLTFHHLENKKFNIGHGLYSSHRVVVSVQELMNEISKCKILCSNCHAEQTVNVKKFNELKNVILQKVENHKELQKPIDRLAVFDMYDGGEGVSQIAKELGCCKSTISMILTKRKKGAVAELGL